MISNWPRFARSNSENLAHLSRIKLQPRSQKKFWCAVHIILRVNNDNIPKWAWVNLTDAYKKVRKETQSQPEVKIIPLCNNSTINTSNTHRINMTQRQNIQRHRNKFIKREPTKFMLIVRVDYWNKQTCMEKNVPLDVNLMTVIDFKLVVREIRFI